MTLIQKLRKDADAVLVVESGDDLTGSRVPPAHKERRAKFVVDCFDKMGLQAMATGELDKDTGVNLHKLPAGAMVNAKGVQVGVFAMDMDPVPDPGAMMQKMGASLRKRGAKLVLALVHGNLTKVRDSLRAGKGLGIDYVVLSHGYGGMQEHFDKAWIFDGPAQGKYMGQIDLHITAVLNFMAKLFEGLNKIYSAQSFRPHRTTSRACTCANGRANKRNPLPVLIQTASPCLEFGTVWAMKMAHNSHNYAKNV